MGGLLRRVASQPGALEARFVASAPKALTIGVRLRPGADWAAVVAAVRDALSPDLPGDMTVELVELR